VSEVSPKYFFEESYLALLLNVHALFSNDGSKIRLVKVTFFVTTGSLVKLMLLL
jgi:hypothetical protein